METPSRRITPGRWLVPAGLLTLALAGVACAPHDGQDGKSADDRAPVTDAVRRDVADRLAGESLRLAGADPRLSVALALEAAALALEAAALSPTPKVTAALDRLRGPHPVTRFATGPAPVRALGFGGDGRFLVTGDDTGKVTVWDTYTGRARLTAQVRGAVTEAAVSHGAGFAAARGAGGEVRAWDLGTGRPAGAFTGVPGHASGLVFVPGPKELLAFAAGAGTVQVWDTQPWQRRHTFRPDGGAASLTWFYGRDVSTVLASLSARGALEAWDLEKGRRLGMTRVPGPRGGSPALGGHSYGDEDAVVSSGGASWLAWLGRLVFHDEPGPAFQPLRRPMAFPSVMGGMAGLLVAADPAKREVTVWRIRSAYPERTSKLSRLLTHRLDAGGRARLTALATNPPHYGIAGENAPPVRVPVAVALTDGSVTLWDLLKGPRLTGGKEAIDNELHQLCSGTPLILSRQEWRRSIPELPYAPACVEIMKRRSAGGHD
ncbi:WD40 repeat domain-containing protein [Nonomuraea candida]|uniref:WD40 repeat domain-containing protein n=1 Tax=Nonomuraea candida TaxID=359159 RepID=UPI0012F75A95|nr:hypothetical protein [Nonomuraea candida]